MKTYKIELYGETYEVVLNSERYIANDTPAIEMYDAKTGEPFATITVCLPDEPTPDGCAYIDTNNCSWAVKFLMENKLGKPVGMFGFSGFCSYPLFELNMKKIEG